MVSVEAFAPLYSDYLPALLTPVHGLFCPIGVLDVYGAIRLSVAVNWIASDTKGKPRASALQELFGIMVVLYGGETFIGCCTGQPPSWLINPSLGLVFGAIHLLLTRTPLHGLLPTKPSFGTELALAVPDAIGRTLLLTRFSVVPLLHPTSPKTLPATPSTLLLVPFIMAVPFAAVVFSGTQLFSPAITLQTPNELRPWGWTALDAWIPFVLPSLFLSLIAPVKGWPFSLGTDYSEDAAIVVCAALNIVFFVSRAYYNHAPKAAKSPKAKKVKKQ